MSKLKKNWLKRLFLATALGASLLGQPRVIASTTEALKLKAQAEKVIDSKMDLIDKGSLVKHEDAKELYNLIILIQRDYALKIVEELSSKALKSQIQEVESKNKADMENANWITVTGVKAKCIARIAGVMTEVKVGKSIGLTAQKVVSQDFPKLVNLLEEFEKSTRKDNVDNIIKQLELLKKATELLEDFSKDNKIVKAFNKFGIKIRDLVKLKQRSFADLYLKLLDKKENLNEEELSNIKKLIERISLPDKEKWQLLFG